MPFGLAILFVLMIVTVLFAARRRPDPCAPRALNIWLGPRPSHGENKIRYLLRNALFSMACFAVAVLPLFFLTAPPDEGTSFTGDESMLDLAAWMICFPLSAMAFVALAACSLRALALSIFRRRQVFDQSLGKFVNQSILSTSLERSMG